MIDELNYQDEALKAAELKVLGCFAADATFKAQAGVEAVGKAVKILPNGSYFSNIWRGKIWDLILEMIEENIPLSLASLAIKVGEMDEKLPSAIWSEMMDAIDSAEEAADNIEYYAKSVADKHVHRQTHQKLHNLTQGVADGSIDLDELEEGIHSLKELKQHHTDQSKSIGTVLNELVDQQMINHQNPGIKGAKTGFEKLDQTIGGLQRQSFIIVGARPSAGKTALACNMMSGLAKNGNKSLFISLEMTSVQVSTRLIAEAAHTSYQVASYEQRPNAVEHSKITNAMKNLKEWDMEIYDPPSQTISQVCSKIREAGRNGVEVVMIDYVGLIRPDSREQRESRYMLITECSAKLKAAARAANVAVVCLAQLRRESEKNDKPKLSDLRESGQLEQDADAVILINRPQREQCTTHEDGELLVSKNRNGPTGAIDIVFNRKTMTFTEGVTQ